MSSRDRPNRGALDRRCGTAAPVSGSRRSLKDGWERTRLGDPITDETRSTTSPVGWSQVRGHALGAPKPRRGLRRRSKRSLRRHRREPRYSRPARSPSESRRPSDILGIPSCVYARVRARGGAHLPMIDPSARIHPSADLEDAVAIGPRTAVWHRAQIRVGATIGADAIIGRDAFIDEGVVLGDRVKVQNGALVYHGVTVGDSVFIGPGAILTNDRYPRAITSTGDLARGDDWTVSPILIRNGASIGAGAVVVA